MQGVVDVERRDGEVDAQGRPRVARDGRRGDGLEPFHERRPAIRRDLEAGGARVTAVADEQVRAGGEGRPEIERAITAARRAHDVAELRADDRGPAVVLDEA